MFMQILEQPTIGYKLAIGSNHRRRDYDIIYFNFKINYAYLVYYNFKDNLLSFLKYKIYRNKEIAYVYRIFI